jgi:glycine cleavage system H protein
VYAPIAGEVLAVNAPLTDAPEQVNQDAYAAWFFKVKPTDGGAFAGLLDPKAYEAVIGDE